MKLLKLDPDQTLSFTKSSSSKTLKLKNLSGGNVAYKVKTTAPKSYLVRPSSGTLKANEENEVQIILQQQGSSDGAVSNHRFLIQAVSTTSGENLSREEWANFAKETIQEARLNVQLDEKDAAPAAVASVKKETPTTAVDDNASPETIKVKYDELVQYTLQLEKEKKKIEQELNEIRSSESRSSVAGYQMFHVILVALIAFLCSYAAKMVKKA